MTGPIPTLRVALAAFGGVIVTLATHSLVAAFLFEILFLLGATLNEQVY